MNQRTIQFHVKIPFAIHVEDDVFVSSCPPLDVVSQGETKEEALKNLAEATRLFIETCYQMGTLDQVLGELGFSKTEELSESADDDATLDVPLHLLVAQHHAENHAH